MEAVAEHTAKQKQTVDKLETIFVDYFSEEQGEELYLSDTLHGYEARKLLIENLIRNVRKKGSSRVYHKEIYPFTDNRKMDSRELKKQGDRLEQSTGGWIKRKFDKIRLLHYTCVDKGGN